METGLFVVCFSLAFAQEAPTGPGAVAGQEEPLTEPDESTLAEFTLAEINRHDGSDPSLPIYVGLWGRVFDVSSHPSGAKFYAPGKTYAHFAGRDITRATAMFETDPVHLDRAHYPAHRERFLKKSYEKTYVRKYKIVGKFVNPNPPTEEEILEDKKSEDVAKRRAEEKERNKQLIEEAKRKKKQQSNGGLVDSLVGAWTYIFGADNSKSKTQELRR